MLLPEKYRGATILDESPGLVLIETVEGNSFWIRKKESMAPKSEPRAGRHGRKPNKLGFRDKDGTIIYNADGQERLQRAFAARPRSF